MSDSLGDNSRLKNQRGAHNSLPFPGLVLQFQRRESDE